MPTTYWPLADLRLTTNALELRPMSEADLTELADLFPADVELDPAATRYGIDDVRTDRGIVLHQTYWKAVGTWSPQSWALHFVAREAGAIVGAQVLEGDNFLRLRTVDSASWLRAQVRGRGLGKEMRRAVLALAFGPLGARAAVSSAWHDNHASLGVSRALGYRPNGELLHEREVAGGIGGVDVMTYLRLRRDDWLAGRLGTDVAITGFDPCRPLFGLPPLDS